MAIFKKFQLSGISILIIALTCFIIDFSFKNWEKQDRVIEHDVHWYYTYLPAKFIYDDIALEKSDYRFGDNYYLFWPIYTTDGKKVIKTTMGLSIMYAPFFFVAHAYASVTDYPENGFSVPYKIFLLLSAIFYLIIGLDFVRKILVHYRFSDLHISITLLILGLGTNLLCYSSQSAPMSHTYNFCLFAVFIYFTIKWYEQHSMKNTILLGLLLGLISLIRPSNAIILIFFLLYGISSLEGFKQRLSFFRRECYLLNVICFFAFLVWIPQFIYWKTVTGNYLFYSYTDEGFFFDRPRILQGLFSFRKGWLVYTPIMVFSVIGLFVKNYDLKKIRWAIVLFFALNVYIIFSWWCWWYGGTFGQRSMIESYAILALPLAFFVRFIFERGKLFIVSFAGIALFFIWLNIFQTYQYQNLSLHWEGMTKELYFKQFGKLEKIPDYEQYVSYPNFEQAKKGNSSEPDQQGPQGKREPIEKIISFKGMNNKYLSVESDSLVYANKDAASTWESFHLTDLGNNHWAIQAHTGLYLCTEMNNQKEITASRNSIGDWETFTIENTADGFIALKGANNKYLSADEKTLQVFSKSDSLGINEKFKMEDK